MTDKWVTINSELLELWNKHDGGPLKSFPALYHQMNENPELIIITLNPADAWKRNGFSAQDHRWPNDIDLYLKEGCAALSDNSINAEGLFLKSMGAIATDCGAKTWAQIDMFRFVGQNANTVRELLNDKSHKQFLDDHIAWTKSLIQRLAPKVVIIASTDARDIIKTKWGITATKDEEELGEYHLGEIQMVMLGMWWRGGVSKELRMRVVHRIRELL